MANKDHVTTHEDQLVPLRRIEGQVRGLQKMIQEQRYCVDILTQVNSVLGALMRVRDSVFSSHLEGCVKEAFKSPDRSEQQQKINEVIELIRKFKRG